MPKSWYQKTAQSLVNKLLSILWHSRLRVKNSNHLHTELSVDYLKDTKFYLESKASFIHIHVSSIASFKPFLIAGCGNIALFRTVPWLAWSPRLSQNTPSMELFCKKKKNNVLLSNFFPSSNMFFTKLFLANTKRKNRGSPSSFHWKGAFISLSSLVWGKSLRFCTRTRSCMRADAILRNYLKLMWQERIFYPCYARQVLRPFMQHH